MALRDPRCSAPAQQRFDASAVIALNFHAIPANNTARSALFFQEPKQRVCTMCDVADDGDDFSAGTVLQPNGPTAFSGALDLKFRRGSGRIR